MRFSKALDHWNKLLSQRHADGLTLQIERHPLFAKQEIDLTPGVIALCGPNGVGKTRLVRLIAALCSGEVLPAEIKATLTFADSNQNRSQYKTRSAAGKIEAVYPMVLLEALHVAIGDQGDLADLLSQYQPSTASETFCQDVRRALGREYESIEIYDLSDLSTSNIPLPYFRVTDRGMKYDVFEMGSGEIAAFSLLWRLHNADKNVLLIVEEPETLLSPNTQRHVLDIVARQSVYNKLAVMITSHSPEMFKRLELDNIRLLTRTSTGVIVHAPSRRSDLREAVGLDIHKCGVMLVEDESAKALLECIMNVCEYQMAKEYVVGVSSHGDGHVVKSVEFPAATFQNVHQLGVLDGDMRGKQKALPGLFFLPTDKSPDDIAWEALASAAKRMAGPVGIDSKRLDAAVTASSSLDIHDRLSEVARAVGGNREHLRDWAFRTWLQEQRNIEQARELLTEIATYVEKLKSG